VPRDPDHKAHQETGLRLRLSETQVGSLYVQAGAAKWGLPVSEFAQALERSARKHFADGGAVTPTRLDDYLGTLHIEDLALASACIAGFEPAWEFFMREYRGYLRAVAGAITKSSRAGADARELADSLFAELFGLADGKRGERSLFRYFHGRSSLKTWLRAILAQHHVDRIRESRRWEPLESDDGESPAPLPLHNSSSSPLDPHRERYLERFRVALGNSVAALAQDDRQRLELYYAREKTLAEIGRLLGEHESSVSRNLERVRRELRAAVEACLRGAPPLSDAEIALCFQYSAEDAPIDFRQLFPETGSAKPGAGRKKSP
jgi:RNA polymerase sigma factor (sigma-70 family)